jgi:hypothetical protein
MLPPRRRGGGLLPWGCPILQRVNTPDVLPYWFWQSLFSLVLEGRLLRFFVPALQPNREIRRQPLLDFGSPSEYGRNRPLHSLRNEATPMEFGPLQRSRHRESTGQVFQRLTPPPSGFHTLLTV